MEIGVGGRFRKLRAKAVGQPFGAAEKHLIRHWLSD